MLAQTTDSGASNNTMACEMEVMFSQSKNPVAWDSSKNHVRCYAHKLGLVVKKGLKLLGLPAGHIKPTTPPNTSVPIPSIILNDDMEENPIDQDDSDDDDDLHNHQPPNSRHKQSAEEDLEEDLTYDDLPSDGCVVVKGAIKVCISPLPFSVFDYIFLLTSFIVVEGIQRSPHPQQCQER